MTESSQCPDDDSNVPATPDVDASQNSIRIAPCEFDECYRQFASGLRVSLRMRLKNDLDVEDCLNRVFEKLWLRGHQVAPAARRSWLFVVARNEAALVGRSLSRRAIERAGNEEWSHLESGSPGGVDSKDEAQLPLENLVRIETLQRLRDAGQELSDQQVEILRFRFDDDLTFREIADRLQIPLGTALTRVRTAILKLKSILDDEA